MTDEPEDRSPDPPEPDEPENRPERRGRSDWTLVGIGASAGGLDALKAFFGEVPEKPGVPFVVVVHLSPQHESHLAELLQPHCRLPVQQVTQTVQLEPDRVYVIPPNANLESVDTHLRLSKLEPRARNRTPIDHFFRSMAETHDGNVVGVLLTGTGSDGTLGLRRIKESGGLTIVQDPDEAEFDSMPRSALADGQVDLALPVRQIPAFLLRTLDAERALPKPEAKLGEDDTSALHGILAQVRARVGLDLTRYKRSTLLRRIGRRMQLHHVESLDAYLELIRSRPDEARLLFDDVLITVTEFFRDRHVFDFLEQQVIPALFEGKSDKDRVRVWSVGCSTGEEPYSLAMLLLEEAGRQERSPQLQVFATDLHEDSLHRAREGLYPETIASDVGRQRLHRFFVAENGHYRVRSQLREVVVFAAHNLLKDPPFSHLDLIVCRNLLIYLNRGVQEDVASVFHYALQPEGLLVLGTSETIDHSELFASVSKSHAVYRRRNVPNRELRLPVFPLAPLEMQRGERQVEERPKVASYGDLHARIVERYAPPSILVDRSHDVVHYSAHAGAFLQQPGGEPTNNVLKLVREPLRIELLAALQSARESDQTVHSKPVTVTVDGAPRQVVMRVRRTDDPETAGFFLVLFDPVENPAAETSEPGELSATQRELEAELDHTRKRLRAVIEQYESSQEEMQASNEELQSANEELRSTLEELETSKEELQSMNEELSTVNQENRHRVEELGQLSSDLQNLLAATDIATLFLDRELRIVRFTPKVTELFNILGTDRGRPLSDLTHHLGDDETLLEDAREVLEHLVPIEREINDSAGRWLLTRVRPYRGDDDRIEGVVVTSLDFTERKQIEELLAEQTALLDSFQAAAPVGLAFFDSEHRYVRLNPTLAELNGIPAEAHLGRSVAELFPQAWPEMKPLFERALAGETVRDVEMEVAVPGDPDRPRTWWSSFFPVSVDDRILGVGVAVLDTSAEKQALAALSDREERLRELNETLEQRVAERTEQLQHQAERLQQMAREVAAAGHRERKRLARVLHDDLQQFLVAARMRLELAKGCSDLTKMTEAIAEGTALVDQATQVARNLSHQLRPPVLYEDGLVPALHWLAGEMAERHGLAVTIESEIGDLRLEEDLRGLLFESVRELLFNVVKHGGVDAARVELLSRGERLRILVKDEGRGFDVEAAAHDRHASGGLGLFSVRERIQSVGGEMEIDSIAGNGTRVTIDVPLERDQTALPVPETPEVSSPAPAPLRPQGSVPRVVVVDDHSIVREGIVNLLALDPRVDVVGEADSGAEALVEIERLRPDIVLMDVNMPGMSGIETTRQVRARWPDVQVVGLSVQDDPATIQSMRDAGADAFVSKSDDARTMIDTILGRPPD